MANQSATHTNNPEFWVVLSEFGPVVPAKSDAEIQHEIDNFDAESLATPETINVPAMLVPLAVRQN